MSKSFKKTILFWAVFILFLLLSNKSVFATEVSVQVTYNYNQTSALEVFDLVNAERAKAGKPALVWDSNLEAVAMQRAAELVGYFSHTRPNGQPCFQTLDQFGIRNDYISNGENIAWGQRSATEVMNSWMNSAGHKANILSDNYNCIGIAKIIDNGYNTWIQFFGNNTKSINQAKSNYNGNKTTSVEVTEAKIVTNLQNLSFEFNETDSKSRLLGDSRIYYNIESNNSELSQSLKTLKYGYTITINKLNLSSDNANILTVNGDSMYASDTGSTNLILSYQGVSIKIPCTVNKPDITPYLFDYRFYADNNPDLKTAFGYNENALRNHWENCGKKEGRQASPVFNAQYYLANNSDLQAVFGNNYESAYNHFVNNGIAEFRKSSSEYWGDYYRNNNSDLKNFSSYKLLIHYINNGRNEKRRANDSAKNESQAVANVDAIIFNAKFYADMNVDLRGALGDNESALRNHWNNYGKKEGRVASPAFDVKYYINNNSDLKQAFGSNYEAAINHFISNGAKEGRRTTPVFDVKYYINNNSDLKKAFGTNYASAYEHFASCGINEARKTASNFDVSIYKNKNGDLSKAFGNTWSSYYIHYLTFGINENRKCI